MTPQRLAILEAVRALDRHATAEQVMAAVAEMIPGVSLPTVYATLDLLLELGLVRRVGTGDGPALYDPRTDDHGHRVCVQCGRVDDIEVPVDDAAALRAASRDGFIGERAEVVVTGRCGECAAAAKH